MKIIVIIIYLSMFFTTAAFSDDVSRDLPDTWSNALKAGIENMVDAGIETNDAITMTRSMIQARYEEKLILVAQNIVVDAHRQELPVEPIMNKAFEGIAKNISPPLVVKAMERVASRNAYAFTQARHLVHQKAEISRLGQIMATGVTAGLKHRDVEILVNRLQNKSSLMEPATRYALASEAFLTARDMARQGVSSKMATEVVNQALQQGFTVNEMKSMHHAFMSQAPRSSVEHLAKNFSRAIQQGKNPQNAAGMGKSGREGVSGGTGGHGSEGGPGGSGSGGGVGGGRGSGGGGGSGGSGSGGGSGGGSGSGGSGSGGGSGGGSGSGGSGSGGGSGGGSGSGGSGSGGGSGGGSGSSGGGAGGGRGSGGPGGGT